MNQPKRIFLIAAFCAVNFFSLANAFAQTPLPKRTPEPSFEGVLQTVVASNNTAEKSAVPQMLSSIFKKLKSDFSFSEFRLVSTVMQRVSNNGSLEFKGVAYEANQDKNAPTFSEWSLSGLQNLFAEDGREMIQVQNFKFGQRVPVKGINDSVSYEPIGLTSRFSLPKNTPTVVGSLTTSKPDELMFLVLTVKTTEK